MRRFAIAALLAAGVLAAGPAVHAKTLRWASQGDFLTMDPHAQNESLNNTAAAYIYEPLLTYDEKFELVPALAEQVRDGVVVIAMGAGSIGTVAQKLKDLLEENR